MLEELSVEWDELIEEDHQLTDEEQSAQDLEAMGLHVTTEP